MHTIWVGNPVPLTGACIRRPVAYMIAGLALATSVVPARAATVITINNRRYKPNPATVTVGDTATWRNASKEDHNVRGGPFSSPVVHPGDTFSFTVQQKGTINYTCDFHPAMKGTMRVG